MLEMMTNSTLLFACMDPATKQPLHPLIKSFGFESIVRAKDLQSARDLLRFNRLTLILADYQSDHMDGKTFTHEVRVGETANNRVPIILVADKNQTELDESAIDAGANAIIKLPINVKTLYLTLSAVLNKVPDMICTKNYIGPDRRSPENRPIHNEDRRRSREDIPSPLIDEAFKRTAS